MLMPIEGIEAKLGEGMWANDFQPTDFWPNDIVSFFSVKRPGINFIRLFLFVSDIEAK